MTPDVAVSIATFVMVLWLFTRLGRAKPAPALVDPDVERAREYCRTKIEEHAETLARRYQEAFEEDRRGDRVPGAFAREIESFIGTVLLHDVAIEAPELAPAVRELVTLEREQIYDLILSRCEPA